MELQRKPHLFTVDSPGPSCGVLTLQMLPSHGKSPTWFSWGNRPSCCHRDLLCWRPRALAPPLPRAGPRFSFLPQLSLSFGQLCAGALSAGAGLPDTAGLPLLRCVFLRPHHVSLRYQLIPPPPNTLQPSSRSHCLLSLFSLVSELSGKESRAPASPVLCCCFSLSRYGQGPRARAKEGREEGRQREKEGARGGGTEEARKARRQSVQGSGVRKAWGRNAVGKEDRGPCAKKGVWGKYPGEVFHWSFY